jgi:hypothetical protein
LSQCTPSQHNNKKKRIKKIFHSEGDQETNRIINIENERKKLLNLEENQGGQKALRTKEVSK